MPLSACFYRHIRWLEILILLAKIILLARDRPAMRIALRTSGGRGEYEVAGSQADIRALDLVGLQILFELLPSQQIRTENIVRHTQGKPRIRLRKRRSGDPVFRHAYLILADSLLMPKPKREIGITPGGKLQLVDNNFSVTSIQFEIIRKDEQKVVVYPTNLILSNSADNQARIDVVERVRILINVWAYAKQSTGELARLVNGHRLAFKSGSENSIYDAAKKIKKYFNDTGDPLRQILTAFDLTDSHTYWMGLHTTDIEDFIIDEDLSDLQEAARNRLKQWRLQANRGKGAAKFSRDVKMEYRNTCLFSGYYLPKTSLTGLPGVDSAHILPWAEYELNSVSNGLCLSKLCHWAFDCGILRLKYNAGADEYSLEIPEKYLEHEQAGEIDLKAFHPLVGIIPRDRLPQKKKDWPCPDYIEKYNDSLDAND